MDCDVCGTRSSVGFCASCGKLLCEACGAVCVRCQKMMCPEHVQAPVRGTVLCDACKDRPRKDGQLDASTDFVSMEEALAAAMRLGPEPTGEDRPILTASGYRPSPLWRQSLCAAGIAVFSIALLLGSSGLRAVTQPLGSLVVIAVAGIAALMACVGLFGRERDAKRWLNLIGLGIAVVVILLALIALRMKSSY